MSQMCKLKLKEADLQSSTTMIVMAKPTESINIKKQSKILNTRRFGRFKLRRESFLFAMVTCLNLKMFDMLQQ